MAIAERKIVEQAAAGERLLNTIADPDRARSVADDVAIIVAHPDDETVGCGAQLHRLDKVTVVVVTDGAPRDGSDAQANGYGSTAAYAAARAHELCTALAIANVPKSRVIKLGFSDQTAALHLAALARAIDSLITSRDIKVALTHAFEGGHPDHDATALAVHAVAALKRRRRQALTVIEMPFYHAENEGWATQRFSDHPDRPAIAIRLNATERKCKRHMLAAHKTQTTTLSFFNAEFEYFRPAPAYDFLSLPNDGQLLYERYNWGMTGEHWLMLSRAALDELGLADERWL